VPDMHRSQDEQPKERRWIALAVGNRSASGIHDQVILGHEAALHPLLQCLVQVS